METFGGPLDRAELDIAAWSALMRTHAVVVRVLEREVELATGLPLSWYDVLLELNAAPDGRLRIQEVAARVVLSRTRVSRLIDEIARAKMLDKQPDPTDGRATFAVITDLGRTRLRAAAPVYLDGIREHFARHLSEAQLRSMCEGLNRVLEARGAG